MRAAADFQSVMRRGHKSGRKTVVVYVSTLAERPTMVGFAVSKAVGRAVTRNTVKRRLRAIARELLPSLPVHASMVVRALPAAARVPYSELSSDVKSAAASACAKVPA